MNKKIQDEIVLLKELKKQIELLREIQELKNETVLLTNEVTLLKKHRKRQDKKIKGLKSREDRLERMLEYYQDKVKKRKKQLERINNMCGVVN